ncbi:hypothetical protein AMR72_05460 [Flavobacterium psychrophilum]|nr:hypothetical protein AMR72_05460 [Flavobacterium psychrophilum]AOE52011.1 hypothetical protein ALW18_05455 [Flavobacterium psychrophilum]
MQSVQLQKDKLDLIEWITQLEDPAMIQKIKQIMIEEDNYGFSLSDEQKLILEEGTEKYISGEERAYSWEEIKNSSAQLKKLINEKKA